MKPQANLSQLHQTAVQHGDTSEIKAVVGLGRAVRYKIPLYKLLSGYYIQSYIYYTCNNDTSRRLGAKLQFGHHSFSDLRHHCRCSPSPRTMPTRGFLRFSRRAGTETPGFRATPPHPLPPAPPPPNPLSTLAVGYTSC